MQVCGGGLGYLPICLVLVSFGTFIGSYIIAILKHDVAIYFPYISDTGTKPPESCIFGQFLNIAATLAFCTMYVRYKLVASLTGNEDTKLRRLNNAGLVLGTLSSLGLSIVANFQETVVEPVHLTGASLVLGCGVVYEFVQTYVTYQMHPDFNGQFIARIRLLISVISAIGMVMAFTSAGISRYQTDTKDKLHWKPDEKGFTAHIVSTMSEWVTAAFFLFYFFTYVRDFQKVNVQVKAELRVRHLDEHPYQIPDERSPLLA
ncbi:DNA damage-regulated autophagy modulator protein 2-like isoform X2 [Mizuhopecten yessoensis]|nr:DNA damage-regulated autophagy modulator protein 2-like isoform X2 [Mizuhopecten yessoensis]XP_021349476.1 DNA damage-regulated autophagy modulator protein 2-like isoform X2 [Mizuhopecten yessoensis]